MPTTYDTAPADVLNMIVKVTRLHHPKLHETGAKVGAIFARNETGPAVRVHGCAALACVQAVSAKRRPHCEYDAEITIDASEWDRLNPFQQEALIDHELSHLRRKEHTEKKLEKLRREDPDAVAWKIDNNGRPVLGTVPADFTPGDCFADVIARHGPAAVEFVGAERFKRFADEAMAVYHAGRVASESQNSVVA